MNLENSKRIVKWSIVIVILIAIIIFITHHIIGIIKREKTKELQADLLLVQAKIEIVKGKNSVNGEENPLKGLQLSKIQEKVNIKEILESKGVSSEDLSKYYILRNSDLSSMELQELIGKNSGSYIVNYENYEVIYTAGYENANGLWCYKISELNKQPEKPAALPAASTNTEENSEETKTEEETSNEEQTNTEANQTENQAEENKEQPQIENAEEKRAYILDKLYIVVK